MNVIYLKETGQDLETVGKRLEESAKAHKFGVITVIDLKAKMAEKGVDFSKPCKIYEVCNPVQAKRALEGDMTIATALPCRIAVYEEQQIVKVATMLPTAILGMLSVPEASSVAQEVESVIKAIIDDATRA